MANANFKNSPRIINFEGKRLMEIYTHQPLTFDYFDVHCQIMPNGHVKLTKPADDGSGEYDEIEIRASLIFKLVAALKDTRSTELIPVDEMGKPINAKDVGKQAEATNSK